MVAPFMGSGSSVGPEHVCAPYTGACSKFSCPDKTVVAGSNPALTPPSFILSSANRDSGPQTTKSRLTAALSFIRMLAAILKSTFEIE